MRLYDVLKRLCTIIPDRVEECRGGFWCTEPDAYITFKDEVLVEDHGLAAATEWAFQDMGYLDDKRITYIADETYAEPWGCKCAFIPDHDAEHVYADQNASTLHDAVFRAYLQYQIAHRLNVETPDLETEVTG